MKVFLINPPDKGYYYKLGAIFPPLGLFYISSYLRSNGYDVKLIDMNVEDVNLAELMKDADVVGISSDTVRFPEAVKIAKLAKEIGKIVVMGGPHPSFAIEEIFNENLADYVVIGEGEVAFKELLDNLRKGERYPADVRGLAFMENGKLRVNTPVFIGNLDELPFPDRENFDMKKYRFKFDGKPATSIITSRGCPFACEFCSASQFMGRRIRKRSVENVVEELKILKNKYGYGSVIFFDDNFTLFPERVMKLSEEMIKRNLRFSWWAFSRADELLGHEDMVEAMAKSGCKMLFIGFESANEEVLDEYKKNLKPNIAFDVVKLLKKFKIKVFGSFIIGALNETKTMVEKTIEFAKKLRIDIIQISVLTPYPGTKLFEKLKDRLLTKNWKLFDGTHLVFKHPNFTPEEMRKLFIKAYFKIYSSPIRLFKRGLPFFMRLILKHGYS
ncbi:MAG: B12-binding domain-containing radical SAM protein [Thermotogae bacterium]|nr:B12-binding domain-containing radical SAM protein [Thermotogota bacterium]